MPTIICDGVDITAQVGAMFDSLVGSMDWGSGFLSDDEIEAILTVASLAGFDTSSADPSNSKERELFTEPAPSMSSRYWRARDAREYRDSPEGKQELEDWRIKYDAWCQRKKAALDSWRAQFHAKAEALRKEANER